MTSSTNPERAGRLNWPQLDWLAAWRFGQPDRLHLIDSHVNNGSVALAVPGLTVPEALAVVRTIIGRYESLRTTVRYDGAGPGTQQVWPAPATDDELGRIVAIVARAEAEETFAEVRAASFDLPREWPVRALLARTGDRVHDLALVVDHVAADGWALRILREELAGLCVAATREDPLISVFDARPVEHPLDTVTWEQSDDGARHLARALDFWAAHWQGLRDLLPERTPHRLDRIDQDAVFQSCTLTSPSLLAQAKQAAKSLRVPVTTVFLTAYGDAMCDLLNTPAIGVQAHAVNRRTTAAQHTVSNMFMRAPILVSSGGGTSRATADLFRAQLQAGEFANVDCALVDELRRKILPDGLSPVVASPWFNFLNASVAQLTASASDLIRPDSAAPVHDTVRVQPTRHRARTFMLRVTQNADHAELHLVWRTDVSDQDFAVDLVRRVVTIVGRLAEA